MNFSLLDKILEVEGGFLATILRTEGHTYQKTGARALFRADATTPVWGNLGSLCADQDIAAAGSEALADGRPRTIRIDTGDENDAQIGYGTACGGSMELLVEPVLEPHRDVYREISRRLEAGGTVRLVHDIRTGVLSLGENRADADRSCVVEEITPPRRIILFGATPLARRLCSLVADMDFTVHVIDWRPALLEEFAALRRVRVHDDGLALAGGDIVLALSHSFERDRHVLGEALTAGCSYIGLLSSKHRRDLIFAALGAEGFAGDQTSRIHSPVGIDIGARTDPEIAVSIAADLVRSRKP